MLQVTATGVQHAGMIENDQIARVRLPHTHGNERRPSKITVPEKAHPFAKLVFAEMRRQGIRYPELEALSGVLLCTTKAHRFDNAPGLATIEANLGALGWTLVPVPKIDRLPPHVVEALDEIGEHFRNDQETYGAALLAAATFPERARRDVAALRERAEAKRAAA